MRRLFAHALNPGTIALDAAQSHHARTVLRLGVGDTVELFDRDGAVAVGIIASTEPTVTVDVDSVDRPAEAALVTIASAVPKGDRADWMIEKLSELGVLRFIPLRTARSVVHPEGAKLDRWRRIATESAKQCKRGGLMRIDPLTPIDTLVEAVESAVVLDADADEPLPSAIAGRRAEVLLIGPEGGWTPDELARFRSGGLTPARLGRTILRIETAAVVAAGIVACSAPQAPQSNRA